MSKDDPVRNCELAAYFTHFDLDPVHLMLTLKSAQNYAFKLKNFNDAGSFSRASLVTFILSFVHSAPLTAVDFCLFLGLLPWLLSPPFWTDVGLAWCS